MIQLATNDSDKIMCSANFTKEEKQGICVVKFGDVTTADPVQNNRIKTHLCDLIDGGVYPPHKKTIDTAVA